jgi:hypothetical protein
MWIAETDAAPFALALVPSTDHLASAGDGGENVDRSLR